MKKYVCFLSVFIIGIVMEFYSPVFAEKPDNNPKHSLVKLDKEKAKDELERENEKALRRTERKDRKLEKKTEKELRKTERKAKRQKEKTESE